MLTIKLIGFVILGLIALFILLFAFSIYMVSKEKDDPNYYE